MTFKASPPKGAFQGQSARKLSTDVSTATVVNTTTETTLTAMSVRANLLATVGALVRFEVGGDLLNNTGSAQTLIMRVKYGSTTLLTTEAKSFAASANRRDWLLTGSIWADTASTQRALARLEYSDPVTDTFPVLGVVLGNVGYGTSSESPLSDKDVTVTAQLGAANSALDIRCHIALLELL